MAYVSFPMILENAVAKNNVTKKLELKDEATEEQKIAFKNLFEQIKKAKENMIIHDE